jgi:hypothetical protein
MVSIGPSAYCGALGGRQKRRFAALRGPLPGERRTGAVVPVSAPRRFSSRGERTRERTSGGVRAAHAAAALGRPLVLVQAAPGAVLLGTRDRVIKAFEPHRASSADRLGLALPDLPLRLALAVRTEEEQQVFATARGSILPTPVRAGKHSRLPTYLRHRNNHLNQRASNSALQLGRQAREHANQSCPGTSVARYNASSRRDVPMRGFGDRVASGHYTERLEPACRFTRPVQPSRRLLHARRL